MQLELSTMTLPEPLLIGGSPNPLLAPPAEPVADPAVISQSVIKRPIPKREILDLRRIKCAAEAVASLDRDGMELFGLTKGQFSLTDIIEALLVKTGPADLSISTWTAANGDVTRMPELVRGGAIRSCRWLVDLTFMRRCPQLAAEIRAKFGTNAIRVTKTHAKFCTITNDEWQIAMRSSMNLNQNPRLESFQVGHDPELCRFLSGVMDEIWQRQHKGVADLTSKEIAAWWNDQG
jgi:hypothetical protein